MSDILAIDFGTSNTAVAVLDGGLPRRLPIEAGAETLPTAVFFPARGGPMRLGEAAGRALVAGDEGRYLRALKSVLGTALLHEPRLIGGQRRTLAGIITAFLADLRARAGAITGRNHTRVLSGRPVHFHTADTARDARAEADLRGCYHAAGFTTVDFLPEPEAAALACHGMGADGLGLVVDIGGGTSDFSVYRAAGGRMEVLASHGIRLGGTDFDHAVSMTHAMPLLGLGGEVRREMGPGLLPVPNAVFADLATWAKIPFLYSPETRRLARDLAQLAVDKVALGRLVTVLEHELGHDLAFAVERGKIAANRDDGTARIAMGMIEAGLAAPVTAETLGAALAPHAVTLGQAAAQTVAMAGVAPDDIGSVILVGGSSLMRLVGGAMANLFPQAAQHRAQAFTAVVDGLALATARL